MSAPAVRSALNHFVKGNIVVLFDGRCGFCKRSVQVLRSLDWLHRLEYVNFYDTSLRERIAPDIPLAKLQQAMHIKLPSGRFFMGFDAFRELSWHLPLLWVVAPLLYIPGMKAIGDAVYGMVARHRRVDSV